MLLDSEIDWPKTPYLGLQQLEAKHRLLFAGRDDDLDICIRRLSRPSIRLMVLHGVSGSGKSSFLRAGLVPCLTELAENSSPIQSIPIPTVITGDVNVIAQIASEVYSFIINPRCPANIGENPWPNLAAELRAYGTSEEFVRKVRNSVDVLIKVLEGFNKSPRYPFILFIDQIEDLLSSSDEMVLNNFVKIVKYFDLERLNGKLVIAVRTEWYGRFASILRQFQYEQDSANGTINRLTHYFLENPDEDQLVAAITRPTQKEIVLGVENSAFSKYRFSFSENLPGKIVSAVLSLAEVKNREIGALPLVQVICKRLYQEGKWRANEKEFQITSTLYDEIFSSRNNLSSAGVLEDYLNYEIEKAIEQQAGVTNLLDRKVKVGHCRRILAAFSKDGFSGSRLTSSLNIAELQSRVERIGLTPEAINKFLELLNEDDVGLLTKGDGENYRLQHDLLSLAFTLPSNIPAYRIWQQAFKRERKQLEEFTKYTYDDLFGDTKIRRTTIKVADNRFWDHKALPFAVENEFFSRLGFDTEIVHIATKKNASATQILETLKGDAPIAEDKSYRLFCYPMELMESDELNETTSVAIMNSFAGFFIIGHLKDNWSISSSLTRDDLGSIINQFLVLDGLSFIAEEEGALEFFQEILHFAKKSLNNEQYADIDALYHAISVVKDNEEGGKSPGQICIMKVLDRNAVAIVTAQTWAATRLLEADVITILEPGSFISLANDIKHQDVFLMPRFASKTKLHNSLNIDIPAKLLSNKKSSMLLRLTSIALFTAERIWAFDEEFIDWIYNEYIYSIRKSEKNGGGDEIGSEDMMMVTYADMLDALRRSCSYCPSSSYFETYFGLGSELQFVKSSDNFSTTLFLFQELMRLMVQYQKLSVKVSSILEQNSEIEDKDLLALIAQAQRHSHIRNYYDAVWLLSKAHKLLQKDTLTQGR